MEYSDDNLIEEGAGHHNAISKWGVVCESGMGEMGFCEVG